MILNSEKIKKELETRERPVSWLARKIGMTGPGLHHQLKIGTVKNADKIADVLKMELADVVIIETESGDNNDNKN